MTGDSARRAVTRLGASDSAAAFAPQAIEAAADWTLACPLTLFDTAAMDSPATPLLPMPLLPMPDSVVWHIGPVAGGMPLLQSLTPFSITATTPLDLSSADALAVPQARALYLAATGHTLDGTGLKIGIMSDSFNVNGGEAAAIAGGYLPSASLIHILSEGPGGNDEGQAMAELIHSIAPGAEIYFYTAFNGETDFANGIAALASAGCNVIVDDVTYLDEAFYQRTGPVTLAAQQAVASGVDYFTSANNNGKNFYESTFNPMTYSLPGIGSVLTHNVSGGSPYEAMSLGSNARLTLSLQWSESYYASRYNLGVGIYSYNSGTATYSLVANLALGSIGGAGLEASGTLSNTAGTYYLAFYESASQLVSGQPITPGTFKLIMFNGSNAVINGVGSQTGSGTSIGHELASGVNAVAAVNVANTPVNGVSTPVVASYSAYGPGTILLAPDGTPLATPISAGAPAFAATDGSPTTVFNPFYGTSAAAPNAAAVSLLMLQADSRLVPTQITYLLSHSAIATASALNGGAGLVQADSAVQGALTAATTPIWTGQGGSILWSNPANWSNNALPGGSTVADITNGIGLFTGTYTVEFDLSLATLSGLLLDGGGSGALPVLQVDIGGTLDLSSLTLGWGSLNLLGSVVIGAASASPGAVVIGSGGTETVTAGGTASFVVAGSGGVLSVGAGGAANATHLLNGGTLVLATGATANNTSMDKGSAIGLPGLAYATGGTAVLNALTDVLTITQGGTISTLQLAGSYTGITFALASDNPAEAALGHPTGTLVKAQCFCAGTLIATPHGKVPVEALQAGDRVSLPGGGTAPVLWRGQQTVAGRFADPARFAPVCIRAGALAENVPSRDLHLSPGHALLIGGVLVQAGALVNGTSITQAATLPDRFCYYHLELPSHALVLAEDAQAESWLDGMEDMPFDNLAERAPNPHAPVAGMELPRVKSPRQLPPSLRRQLAMRAALLAAPLARSA